MRSYDNCFTGTDAVDVVFHYLQRHGGLEQSVEIEKVVKLCQVSVSNDIGRGYLEYQSMLYFATYLQYFLR